MTSWGLNANMPTLSTQGLWLPFLGYDSAVMCHAPELRAGGSICVVHSLCCICEANAFLIMAVSMHAEAVGA